MPKVSVLMPIYKTKEEYLRQAIESILNQTFSDFEFLILDDCPEDNRENIVKSYKDKRIKYFKNDKNMGITRSRNKLIDLAEGMYLAVFDHDDISLPQRLEKEVAVLDGFPEIGVVGCWREDVPSGKIFKFPESDIEIKKILMDICAITHSASMIRKSVLTDNHLYYEEQYSPSEDYCLWLRLIKSTKFYNIQEVLLQYRIHEQNTTISQQNKMVAATKKLHAEIRCRYPSLYKAYLDERTHIIKIKLFHIIPLIKIKITFQRMDFYLFNIIPFLVVNKKIPLWPR